MEIDVTQALVLFWLKISQFFDQSVLFVAIKFFLFIYVGVLLVDIVLLLILKGLSSDLKVTLLGTERPLTAKSKLIKRWEAILARLETDNQSQFKVAVLEADALADEILSGIGYKGATMAEKFEEVRGGQLETKDVLMEAHEARNQIVHNEQFLLSKEEAKRYLENYHKFFDEVELF